jgi:carbonic anhydrase
MITSQEALKRLKEGNQRFLSGVLSVDTMVKQMKRDEPVEEQAPFAIILGCSDSRVPAEIIFDQGLGYLFVIRVDGNIVAPSQVGSVEFAAKCYNTPLVVVLGHTMCGAVMATIEELEQTSSSTSSNVLSIVNRIRPSVEPLYETELRNNPEHLLQAAIKSNIRAATSQLQHGSSVLENLIYKGTLSIIGAEYSLQTGEVEFFDMLPDIT